MHTTDQLNTALAGRYAIDRLVGEGGMATVYLARDVRHNRKVALKVLRPDLGAVVGVERFLSEIQVTANLQHPNLLPLFDSGEAGGLLFYVMPYIEGESLRARITREKQLPIDAVVQITTAVASALDYAHRQGVIHRDLKPENILIHEGQPLVADFGIALAVSNAGGNRITQTGLSLGTPQYMSPEQATGDRTIDARTDVYSLGAVAYEMLTGEPPHTGTTSQAVIARMLTERPRGIQASRPNVPVYVAAAVEQALEKLPADRWASAKEFSEGLSGARPVTVSSPASNASQAAASSWSWRHRLREIAAWAIAAGGVATAGYFATRETSPAVPGWFAVELPDSVRIPATTIHTVALSRDGTKLAILGEHRERLIYLRRLDEPIAQPVRGTEGALFHSFSPDGKSLMFVAPGGALKTVATEGGTPQTIADSVLGYASWGDRRTVLYAFRNGLWRVSSDGGDRRQVVVPDSARGISRIGFPEMLPGGTHALAAVEARANVDLARLVVVSLEDGKLTDLGIVGRSPRYVSSGHVLFARSGGVVYAVPFSLRKLAVTGPPVMVVEQVRQAAVSAFDAAHNGTLAFESGTFGGLQWMYLVDRAGNERQLQGPPRMYREPRVSPDGRRIAVRVGTSQYDGGLWIYDIASGALTRLTPDSNNARGEWTKDGKRVVFVSAFDTHAEQLRSVPWDGSAAPTALTQNAGARSFAQVSLGKPGGVSAIRRGPGNGGNLLLAPTDSLHRAQPFMDTPASEQDPHVSPNGRLLSYTSNTSGRNEVYVTTIPGPGPHVQVSIDGGTESNWSPDGRTLYYRGPRRMMAATVAEGPVLAITRRDSLFVDTYRRYANHATYDVMPNGREFLMTRGPETQSTIYVIVNWQQLSRVRGASEQDR